MEGQLNLCKLSACVWLFLALCVSMVKAGTVSASDEFVQAMHGGSVTLQCTAASNDTTVTWSSDSMMVDISNSSQTTVNEMIVSQLYLTQLNTSYCTTYICTTDSSMNATVTLEVVPTITLEPSPSQPVLLPLGDLLNLSCTVDIGTSDSVNITWITTASETLPLSLESDNGDGTFTSTLPLMSISSIDYAGNYSCVAGYTNCVGTVESEPISLVLVSIEPYVLAQPDSDVVLNCTVNSPIDFTTISWSGPNGDLNETNRTVNQDTITSTVAITSISFSEGGTYTCTATNIAATVNSSTTLFIYPRIVPSTLTSRNGENRNFTCEVQSSLMSAITWDRLELGSGGGPVPMDLVVDSGSGMMPFTDRVLSFEPVMFEDQGTYQCVANTNNGEIVSNEATLVVSPEGNVSVSPVDQTFNRSSMVILTCSTSGGPDNGYQWLRSNETLSNSSELTLDPVVGGEYTCTVTNLAGSGNATTNVFVNLEFTQQPNDTLATNSLMIMLTCEAEGFLDPAYQWFRSNNQVIRSDVIGDNSSNLLFDPVLFGDEGNYYCTATSNGISINSTTATLTVSPGGLDVIANQPDAFSLGDNVTFTCSSLGGPDNMFQWQKEGEDLPSESLSILTLTDVNATDGGLYTCVVTNAAGNDSSDITLNISPYFILQPNDTLTNNGDSLTLSCGAEGFPDPVYQWFRNDNEMIRSNLTGVNSNMLLFEPVLFGDEGGYYCTATSNGIAVNSTTAIITVSPENLNVAADPPNVSLGDSVTFTCSVQGGPDNMFQWQKEGEDIPSESQFTLTLTNVNATDGGVYTCVVTNAAGNDSSDITLNISPYFIVQPNDTLTNNGDSQTLTCEAEGFPDPVYQWFRNDNEMVRSNVTGDNSSMLLFDSVLFGDEGDYYCTATSNGISVNSTIGTLTVSPGIVNVAADPPDVLSFGDNVTFTCSALGGPDNMFQWQKDGQDPLSESQSTLTLTTISAMDGGLYTCVVTNAAGNDSSDITLNISLYFIVQPNDILTNNGDSQTLTCGAEGFPDPVYHWFRNDNEMVRSNLTAVNSSMLLFDPVLFGDEGDYYCSATSNGISVNSSIATLTVSPGGLIVAADPPGVLSLGNNVTFTCTAQGGPNNMFQWQKDGQELFGESQSTLTLTTVNATDGGLYTCAVTNAAGNDSSDITLNISPYFIVQPNDTLTNNGDSLTLTCGAEGFPDPVYQWFRNDNEMVRSNLTGDNSSMLLFDPVLFGDEGDYYCTATSNGISVNSTTATLTVSPEGSVSASPSTSNVFVGGNETFTCSSMGDLGNVFTWIRLYDGEMVGNMSVLTVSVAGATNGGVYRCDVVNNAGNDSDTVTLNVGPVIDVPPVSLNATSTESITLSCDASGFPVPSITWLHNGTELQDDVNRTNITELVGGRSVNSTLTVTMALRIDSGNYICNISSPVFASVASNPALVLVQDRPEQPQAVTAEIIDTRSVVLMWEEPHDNNAPVLGYRVSYNQPAFLGGGGVVVNSSEEIDNITGLRPGVLYGFTVIAFNEIGDSRPSEVAMVTTAEEAPASPPENVMLIVISSTEIRVSWTEVPEIDRNGIITMYEVMYEPLMTFGGQLQTSTSIANNTSVILPELQEYVNYSISVRAYTSVGPSNYSEQVIAGTSEDAPASPPENVQTEVMSSTEIRVSWTEVPEIDRNGIITMYEVMYEPLMTFGVLTPATVNTTNLTIIVGGLEKYVNYSISVRAYTSEGPGPYSEDVTARTMEDVPDGPPRDVNTTALSSTELHVSWNEVPEIDRNGIITMYEVMYEPLMTFDGQLQTLNVTTNSTSINLNGLQEYVNYNISVRAYTSEGPGNYSEEVTTRTLEDAPASPPENVQTDVISSTEIRVSWTDVSEIYRNGIITMYEVMYEPLMTFGELTPATVNTTNLTIIVGGLEEYVEYNISVRAYTSVGPGPYSEEVTNRTFEDAPASPPENVQTDVISSTEIRVSWTEVSAIHRNGIITMYEVMYEPLMTFDGQLQTNTSIANNTSVILPDLQEYVNYSISVRAYTREGPSNYSEEVIAGTSEDVPGSPPQNVSATVLSSTEISVSWTEVPEIDRNGIITMYEVMYVSRSDNGTVNISDSSILTVNLTKLEESETYFISVRAYTIVGPGPYSEPEQRVMTLQDIPGPVPPPPAPSMENITATSALVSWGPPPEANGVIISYTVNFVIVDLVTEASGNVSGSRRKRQVGNSIMECVVGGGDNVDRNVTVDGNQTSTTLSDLTPYAMYEFRVQATTDIGSGNFSETTNFSTPESVPSQPRDLVVSYSSVSSDILEVTWIPPLCDNGVRTQYTLEYIPIESDGILVGTPRSGMNLSDTTTSINITGLTPNTGYNISLSAWTRGGQGETNTTMGMTDEEAPGSVTELSIISTSTQSISTVNVTISWMRPSARNGPFEYILTYSGMQPPPYTGVQARTNDNTVVLEDTGDNPREYMFGDGLAFTSYTATVTALNIKTERASPITSTDETTVAIRPSVVTNLTAVATSAESILVTWDLPVFPNGAIQSYIVFYRESNDIVADPVSMSNLYTKLQTPQDQQQGERLVISSLKPYTNYTIFVQAIGGTGLTGTVDMEIIHRTNSTVPPAVVVPVLPTLAPNSDTIQYNLPLANFTTGPLKFYGVIVVRNAQPSSQSQDYLDAGPFMSGATYYIAAAWDNSESVPNQLTVGDGTRTTVRGVEYVNVQLSAGTSYGFLVRVEIVSDNGEPLVTSSELMTITTHLGYSPAGAAIGTLLLITMIVVLVVAVALGLLWYRNRYYMYVAKVEGYAENDLEFEQNSGQFSQLNVFHNTAVVHLGTLEAIPVSHFKAHVKKMHANDDYLFSEEYANVEPSHAPTTEGTHNPHNTAKNRYANIPSYDHSRVKLKEIPNRPGSDYINGNYIDGYHQPNAFIATQGPVPDSVSDFWRMVWEQGSATIVMLTNLQEKGRIKCHQYWPDDRGNMYGSIRVHLQEVLSLADYTIRTFSLQREGSKEERIITQYHYTVWPDHGVPEHPTPLLHFVRKVTSSNPTNAGPIMVHCSAGVGRTGTFICLFTQLKKIQAENSIDIFGFVRSMRYNRCSMVQTELQYVFIHDALLEAIECGVHEVAARDLKEQYKRLGVLDSTVGLTRLESEFEKLDSTVHRRPSKSIGTLHINKSKNRYASVDMIPYDVTRCRLSFIPGVDGSDYINANLIAGYHKRRAFIATQAPLPDTGDDFWRMIWERQTATIVMLTRERESGRVKCHKYWPSTGAQTFSNLQVILHAVNEYPDYTLREFKIVDTKDSSSLPVKQFQYTGWPEEGVPDSGSGLIDLIGQVQKWQRSSGDKPVVVHCSGGTGRTGTFIAVSVLLERLKAEGVVDVFHTVRALRLQRPAMVQTVDQYEFVYKTILEYLDSFELYANFK